MKKNVEVKNTLPQHPKGFKRTYILSHVLVVGLMVGVTIFIEHIRSSMVMADKKPVVTKVLKVAAIGDSITYGYTPSEEDEEHKSYPTRLQSLLGNGYKVYNYGLSGRTLLSTGDAPYAKEEDFAQSHMINPDIVVIMLGTNDSKPMNWNAPMYRSELTAFVASYKKLPSNPKVYLLTIPPIFNRVGELTPGDFSTVTGVNEIVPIIRQVAKATNTPVIDIYSTFKYRPNLFSDGVHPTHEGYKLLAKTVYESISKPVATDNQ